MKNRNFERLGRLQRQYHRHHPWRLGPGGLFVPHSYAQKRPDDLSWWDDVGFIVNGRRVIVWWRHPRYVYENAIEEQAWREAGPGPDDDWVFEGGTQNYRRLGASRKKLVSRTLRQPSEESARHYREFDAARERLAGEGIDFEVRPACRFERLTWALGMSLVAPLEVRNETELADLAGLARQLVMRATTLEKAFPDYRYGRDNWLQEREQFQEESASNALAEGSSS
jgi:hypothetical protein